MLPHLLLSLALSACQPGDRALGPLCVHETVDSTTFTHPVTFSSVYAPAAPKKALWGWEDGVVIDGNQDFIAVRRTHYVKDTSYIEIEVFIWDGSHFILYSPGKAQ